ncbi:hypothetical protein SKAU_G00182400 [Synaphobranchus kaupii]|uniref:Uncharacterized protein n=1 Tax=Synaphobranchus kaupii TaxID=118154 RepID=A0A9Q1FC52_SYNKA|nr:hypothetical protein SKAU_G00182400 [Synaphobranchus kaupii]
MAKTPQKHPGTPADLRNNQDETEPSRDNQIQKAVRLRRTSGTLVLTGASRACTRPGSGAAELMRRPVKSCSDTEPGSGQSNPTGPQVATRLLTGYYATPATFCTSPRVPPKPVTVRPKPRHRASNPLNDNP